MRTVEAQGASAQAANRTSGDLEHIHAFRIHTAFGMNRPVAESERPRRRAYLVQDGLPNEQWCARGLDVNGFLEKRADEGIWLVENDERPEDALGHDAFNRELIARDVGLHECATIHLVTRVEDVGCLQESGETLERPDEVAGLIHPHHSAASREG